MPGPAVIDSLGEGDEVVFFCEAGLEDLAEKSSWGRPRMRGLDTAPAVIAGAVPVEEDW